MDLKCFSRKNNNIKFTFQGVFQILSQDQTYTISQS